MLLRQRRVYWLLAVVGCVVAVMVQGAWGAGTVSLKNATCETDRVLFLTEPVMTGRDVEELQAGLQERGFFQGAITGRFDGATEEAVRRFQEEAGLPVDGRVDSDTWDALAASFDRPAVTKSAPPTGELIILVDIPKRELHLYSDGQIYKTYPITVGSSKTPSPIGEWKIVHKDKHWGGGFGTRWMGINVPWGIYGIHGTNKPWHIGDAESAGCFRMLNHDVEELYDWVPIGTPVIAIGPVDPDFPKRVLRRGNSGQDVVFLQLALRNMGFSPGVADARFGPDTEEAVKASRHTMGWPSTGSLARIPITSWR